MKTLYKLSILFLITACNYNNKPYSCESDLTSDKDGFQKILFKNGKLKAVGHFLENKPNGFIKEYYTNGKLKTVGHYYKGKLYGFVKSYNNKGTLIFEGNCDCKPVSKLSK